MTTTDWIGFLGVFQILLAYVLNVTGKTTSKSVLFMVLNLTGASMACLASILLYYWPFIILEGVWALVSFYALISHFRKD